jgi:hypothetical protein
MRSVVVVLAFCIVAISGAPTTYPFENEAYVPPNPPAATPDYSYTDEDPGGYHHTYIWHLDLNTVEMPFCIMLSDCNQFTLVYAYNLPPQLPAQTFNCTSKQLFFAPEDFTGMVNSQPPQRLCEVGNCCESYLGEAKFGDDQMNWHSWLDNLASAGMCEEVPTEALYCNMVNGHYHGNCFTRVITGLTRTNTIPCHDSHMLYWLSCPVYQSVELDFGFKAEPQAYLDTCTVEEKILASNSDVEADQICHPYSYYVPSVSTGSGLGSSSKDETSSAKTFWLSSVAVLIMLM